MRSVLCSPAVYHSPGEVKLIVVTRHPELWSWLVWLPHNQHDEMFDACGLRRLVFNSPTGVGRPSTPKLHRRAGTVDGAGRSTPSTMPSPMEAASEPAGPALGDRRRQRRHPEQWEVVTGQKGTWPGSTVLRLATRPGIGSDTPTPTSVSSCATAGCATGATSTPWPIRWPRPPDRYARALARWSPMRAGELSETDSQETELLRALGITDPRRLDVDRLWAESRGRATAGRWFPWASSRRRTATRDPRKDFGGFGFHSVVIRTSGSGKSSTSVAVQWDRPDALTRELHRHLRRHEVRIRRPRTSRAAAQCRPRCRTSADDQHLAERMRKGGRRGDRETLSGCSRMPGRGTPANYEEMRLAGRDLEPVPILLVIIDEYLELFHHHPEWIDLVIHIGQGAAAATSSSPWAANGWTCRRSVKRRATSPFRVAPARRPPRTPETSSAATPPAPAVQENGYALLKVGPRDLEQFRCFYVSAPFVVPREDVEHRGDRRCQLHPARH